MAKNKLFKLTALILVVVVAVASALMFIKSDDKADAESSPSAKMYVDFIDVGQGDCTLLRTDDTVILVDAGESGSADDVVSYLKEKGISKIDCCIATHPHSDHIGALPEVFENFEIDTIIIPDISEENEPTTRIYEKFLLSLKNAKTVLPSLGGEEYTFGDFSIEILGPVNQYDDLNDMSIVARVSYKDTSVMLTGDAETPSEEDILKVVNKSDLSSDILKLGHHASRTSTSDEWLASVDPEFAVISCGLDNDYGHPHKETIEKLENYGVVYYRTDLVGSVTFESDGKQFTLIENDN